MHMADALITPIVGGTMWISTAGIATYSIKKLRLNLDEKKVPLMGVMGAFVFAAQMINFTIPGTGSSGHIGGGLLLAIILGPYAGFLTMASILTIQALFFADGGLLSLGCNIINLGFYTCFITYPYIYKRILNKGYTRLRLFTAAMIASIIGLQLGSFSVVIETLLSGKTELPFSSFLLLMQPIHLAIGIIEGLVVASVVDFIWNTKSEIIENTAINKPIGVIGFKKILIILIIITALTGGILSRFASSNPDGLEWSMFKVSGQEELEANGPLYETLSTLQTKTAFLPDYAFKNTEVDKSTSFAGLVGGFLTLLLVLSMGFILKRFKKRKKVNC
ncbi:MAG: cobalamin biosynthesis protein CbiM [Firmicutes bacterium HGW-Firmicutes-7]|nr:MAG: cobalamin biosynthesis protein CbiM [Firmicutes bacterium HGW-Firmicutes-7]